MQDTTAPEFTFVPADYTVECSDEMPMDDATASTTAEVTIEVSSETTAGDAAGNYVIVRTFTATDDAKSSSATQTITEDTTALSSPSSRLHRRVLDEMRGDATASDTAEGHYRGVQRNHGRCCRLRDRSHVHRHDDAETAPATRTITARHHRSEFTFVLPDYT